MRIPDERKEFFMEMKRKKPVLAVPLGDAAGIGPEIVAKTAAAGFLEKHARPVIVGDERVLRLGMTIAGKNFPFRSADSLEEAAAGEGLALWNTGSLDAATLELGTVSPVNGKEEGDNLAACIDGCRRGLLDGICFAPLNKAALKLGGYGFPSEHEMFAHLYGITEGFGEMNVLEGLWNIRVTSHIPLKDVARNITVESVLDTVRLGYKTLRRAGCEAPRMAMAALNPHGGESGTCGREEIDVLLPAIGAAEKEGISVEGPFPSDTLFIRAFEGKYDGVVTMYHDQGQIAIKLRGFHHCVTVSAGLPHPITTPAHGTAYDIAGKGICTTSAFEDAYALAARMALGDITER